MTTVKWLPGAVADIERLHSFLNEKSPEAATRAARTILKGVIQLKTTPHIGRPMPDDTGRRELFVSFSSGAYVLRYMEENKNTIVVVRVWHSREYRSNPK